MKTSQFGAANKLFIWRNIRILIGGVILITLAWLFIQFWLSSNYIIRTNTSVAIAAQESPEVVDLSQIIQDQLYNYKSVNADLSIYVKALDGSFEASLNPDQVFESASLYKAFLAYNAYERFGNGSLSPSLNVVKNNSLEDCLAIMITVSDNDCGVALQKYLNSYSTTKLYNSRGYTNTDLVGYYPQTSAADVTRLFEDIYNSKHLTVDSRRQLIDHLLNQKINDRIPKYLPASTNVAHKTGDLNGNIHDAGIVYTPQGDYVLVVMSRDWGVNLYQAYDKIGVISQEIFSQINEYK